jgi:cell wall-associated NlpC family hydrolase
MALLSVGAGNAWASNPGGVAAGTVTKPKHAANAPAAPVVPPGAAPITSKSSNIAYHGPVYVRNAAGVVVPYVAPSAQTAEVSATGGSAAGLTTPGKPELLVPGTRTRYVDGLAAAPMSVPASVQEIVWAADQIIGLPYIYGGGHNASFTSPGYDCSGTVSFALHGADLLTMPDDSSEFMSWGSNGQGRWVTIFSNPEHAYMDVAGLRLDTSSADDPSNQQGPRWRPLRHANSSYTVRHPLGL